ncbi:F-box/LRR-repeat protein 16-like [Rhododendron vialii]|uniref:F-box/LRR-repeat protein 16-like n=1 Tax=Rhododendron vialii TaxID=182163 RepID=UPI0026603F61|nr:F-box/LRR-repeat protein 16-like [Rhododendron vialii]
MTRRIGTKNCTDVRSELLFALEKEEGIMGNQDYISELPDECLAYVFKFLCSSDRKNASLVSKQMLKVEGQSRRRLTLSAAQSDLLPSLLSRFNTVTELVIRCHRSSIIDVDDMLILIGKHCGNNRIKELVLIGVNVSCVGLESVARNFPKLEQLTLCGRSKTRIGDAEISYVASNCVGLKKLCIKGCPVTDQGIKAFAFGCPNLVEIKIKKCRGVTSEVVGWLGARRGSLVVNLDVGETGAGWLELDSESDGDDGGGGGGGGGGGLQENGVDIPPMLVSRQDSDGWPPIFRSRFWDFGGKRNFI